MSNRDLIKHYKPNSQIRAYVLGGQAHRVSVHTQQLRGIELVSALVQENEIESGLTATVIGGGFAGLSVASALASQNINVELLEARSTLLPIHSRNRTRIINPSSVTWPASKFSDTSALPFLNWNTGYSQDVANSVISEFKEIVREEFSANVDVICNVLATDIEFLNNKFRTSISGANGRPYVHSDLVFITTGFSFENKISGFDRTSYWEDRNSRPLMYNGATPRIAVVGDGDGAAIDLFRCFWSNLDLERVYRAVGLRLSEDAKFISQLNQIEEDYRSNSNDSDFEAYVAFYESALSSNGFPAFLLDIDRHNAEIVMFGLGQHPFSRNTSPLNKLILGFMYEHNWFKFGRGEVRDIKFFKPPRKAGRDRTNSTDRFNQVKGHYSLKLGEKFLDSDDIGNYGFKNTTKIFDRVIERIGFNKNYCSVTCSIFSNELLLEFEKLNSSTLDMANPVTVSKEIFDNANINDTLVTRASDTIREFIENRLGKLLPNSSVYFDFLSKKLVVNTVGEASSPDVVSPRRWYGLEVKYKDSMSKSEFEEGKLRASKMSSLPTRWEVGALRCKRNQDVTDSFDSMVRIGSNVTSAGSSDQESLSGRISAFAKLEDPELQNDVYAICPRHVLENDKTDPVDLVGLTNSGEFTRRTIGSVEGVIFQDKIIAARRKDKVSIANDFYVFKLDSDAVVDATVEGQKLKGSVSPYVAAGTNGGCVKVHGNEVGRINTTHNHMELRYDATGKILTETFTIACKEKFLDEMESGDIVYTADNQAVGFVIGLRRNLSEVVCVELHKNLRKLQLKIL